MSQKFDFSALRQRHLGSAVDSALGKLDKQAETKEAAANELISDERVQQLVKTAFAQGFQSGAVEGYRQGAEDATVHIVEKLGEGAESDPFVAGPTADAYDAGQAVDHAAETRAGAEELGLAINQNDDAINATSEMTSGASAALGGGGAAEGDLGKEAEVFLERLLKQAEEAAEAASAGGPPSAPVEEPTAGGDEFGTFNPDLNETLSRPSTASFEDLIAQELAAQGGLDPN